MKKIIIVLVFLAIGFFGVRAQAQDLQLESWLGLLDQDRFLFVGDSITARGSWGELLNVPVGLRVHDGWNARQFDYYLIQAGKYTGQYWTAGTYAGEYANWGATKVFINLLTNGPQYGHSAQFAVDCVSIMIDEIKSYHPSSQFFVVSAPPDRCGWQAWHDQANGIAQSMCQSTGKCTYIDAATGMKDSSGLLKQGFDAGDGLHINASGYVEMATELLPYMN